MDAVKCPDQIKFIFHL